MDNRSFKVFGDKELLKECKINLVFDIQEYKNNKYYDTHVYKTLLSKGNIKDISYNEAYGFIHIYISYRNSYFGIWDTENIFRNVSDQVNHIYVEKNDNKVYFRFVGREESIKEKDSYKMILLSKEDYLKTRNINTFKEIEEIEKRFLSDF